MTVPLETLPMTCVHRALANDLEVRVSEVAPNVLPLSRGNRTRESTALGARAARLTSAAAAELGGANCYHHNQDIKLGHKLRVAESRMITGGIRRRIY